MALTNGEVVVTNECVEKEDTSQPSHEQAPKKNEEPVKEPLPPDDGVQEKKTK